MFIVIEKYQPSIQVAGILERDSESYRNFEDFAGCEEYELSSKVLYALEIDEKAQSSKFIDRDTLASWMKEAKHDVIETGDHESMESWRACHV